MSACALCKTPLRHAVEIATMARFERKSRRVACRDCGLIQQDPMPLRAELEAHYRSHEYRREHGQVALWWPPVGRVLPSSPRFPEAHAAMGRSRCEQALMLAKHPEPGSVLDVGCGPGHVLDVYAEEGWLCFGIEPDEEEAAKGLAKDHAVETTTLDRYEPRVRFDLIVSHHVLEHLHDPVGALRRMRGMLAEGGHVVVEVPTVEKPAGTLSQYFQHVHLYDFSRWTLRDAMLQAGLSGHIADGGCAVWAIGKPSEPSRGEPGPGGEWWAGFLEGYRHFGGGD